jgi:protein-S-isoprenylcysteine O-methyltransferase Ste14
MIKQLPNGLKRLLVAAAAGAVIGAISVKWPVPPGVRAQLHFPIGVRLSALLWLLFSVYWSIAATDSAPTKSSESVWSRQLHVVAVNAALLLLLIPVPGLTRRFLPISTVLLVAGLTIQAAFALLAVWARRHLGSNWSGEVRIAKGHELVRSGPYRFVRHPIYTAVLGMYVGTGVVVGELHALVALAVVTLAYWRKIRLEERALRETFPADHDSYRRDTWAWIPGLY